MIGVIVNKYQKSDRSGRSLSNSEHVLQKWQGAMLNLELPVIEHIDSQSLADVKFSISPETISQRAVVSTVLSGKFV
jgi:hypothetical protein